MTVVTYKTNPPGFPDAWMMEPSDIVWPEITQLHIADGSSTWGTMLTDARKELLHTCFYRPITPGCLRSKLRHLMMASWGMDDDERGDL